MQATAKVGFLVIVFAILLYGGYAILGHTLARAKTITLYADFPDAAGTTNGTLVTMAGVRVGTVREVELMSADRARLTLDIEQKYSVPRGSVARIGGSLIGLGATPVQIVPPKAPSGGLLADGDVLIGGSSSPMDTILPKAEETLKELNLTLISTRKLLENDSLQKKLTALMDSSASTLAKFGTLADQTKGLLASANGMMGRSQPYLERAMRDASEGMANIRKSIVLVTQLIESGKYQKEGLALLKQLAETAKKADDLVVSLNTFASDPEVKASIKNTLDSTAKIADSGTRIAGNAEEISKNGITLSQKAIELADKANAIAEDAKTALEKISGFFTRGGAKPALPKVEGHLDLLRQTDPAHWRTDLYGRFTLKDSFLDIGLYDAFESNRAILQLGTPLGSSGDYRFGIYASKPGVGVDFRVAPRVSLRTDLFDINKPKLDFRTQLEFGNGLVGWLGIEKLFDRNAFIAGVGIRK